MDDFLHNLRSGKLKQGDRSNRSYGDPQYKSQRRNIDRRKKELDAFERLSAVKEVLESISKTQTRMADAYEALTHAEERKARAMEVLAKNIYRMLNPDAKDVDELFAPEPAPLNQICAPSEEQNSDSDTEIDIDTQETADGDIQSKQPLSAKLAEKDRQKLFVLIDRMRNEGDSWEKIARHIASEGFPTQSGKGNWRGIMVKNFYDKMLKE